MALKKRKRFNEGGLSDKDAGLEASKDEKVGFFERLRMGNIDDEGSEAYRRFGAGRGRAERVPVEDRVPTPVNRPMAEAAAPVMDALEEANKREPIQVSAGPRADMPKPGGRPHVDVQTAASVKPTKPASSGPKMQDQSYRRTTGATAEGRAKAEPSVSSKYPESRGSVKDSEAAELRRRVREGDQAIERVTPETAMLPGGGLKGLSALAKKLAAPGSKAASGGRELAKVADDVTYLGKSGRRQVGGFDEVGRNSAKRLTDNPTRQLPAPPKQLGGPKAPDKKKMTKKEEREKKTLNPLAWMAGPKGMADDFKKGGRVKMASGGAVSSASKRGDGIATRGKTECKIC